LKALPDIDKMEKVTQKKLEEGNGYLKEADKLVKTTMFRWKPDWDNAQPLYEKAATCFKTAKIYDKAKYAYKKSAECFVGMKLDTNGAKNLEEAGNMAKEEKSIIEAAELYKQASNLMRANGNTDRAADTLVKAAKAIEDSDEDFAISLVKEAINVYEADDKIIYATQTFKYAISLTLINKKYVEALEFLHMQAEAAIKLNRESDLFKMHLSMIIVNLHLNNYKQAEDVYSDAIQNGGFSRSAEGVVSGLIMDSYQQADQQKMKDATSKQIVTFLDNQVAKLAINLKVPDIPAEEDLS